MQPIIGDDRRCLKVASQLKRRHYGSQDNPIRIRDDEATELPQKRPRYSSHLSGHITLSQLPIEILVRIMSEIPDQRTLLGLSLVSTDFQGVFNMNKWEFLRSAYTKQVRRGEYSQRDATRDISTHIEKHVKGVSVLFEATWEGLIYEGKLEEAVDFIKSLDYEMCQENYDILLQSLQSMYDHVVLQTWEAWAGAFTAVDFLVKKYPTNGNIREIQKRLLHQAVSRRQEIIHQSTLEVEWNNVYFVLEKLRSAMHYQGKNGDDNEAEVVLATLTFAIQERLWYEASRQVPILIRLNTNIDVKSLVQKLETICCGAISDNQYDDATGAMDIFLEHDIFREITDISEEVIPCVEEAIENIWEVWATAKGIRWASGHNIFNSVYH
ncbi:hypothetical protein V501_02092 [Pseudogymnoascus sp. VKM F-4519 (FW-2642)]|nr:hypothetical protein V501_02092 [Pseudogymnoascus sp. VKM F-4519 (FW-2642)]